MRNFQTGSKYHTIEYFSTFAEIWDKYKLGNFENLWKISFEDNERYYRFVKLPLSEMKTEKNNLNILIQFCNDKKIDIEGKDISFWCYRPPNPFYVIKHGYFQTIEILTEDDFEKKYYIFFLVFLIKN